MLRRWNLFLTVIVLIFMLSWLIIPGFELPSFLVFLVGSLLFLSLGIEDLKNERKIGGYLYIFVAFVGLLVVVKELF